MKSVVLTLLNIALKSDLMAWEEYINQSIQYFRQY